MASQLPRHLISDFSRGEISPLLNGRSDKPWYHQGGSIVENLICLPTGGVTRRPGTRYVAALKDVTGEAAADQKQRLISFRYNQTSTWILEFGHEYIRVFKGSNHSQIQSGGSPFEVVTPFQGAEVFELGHRRIGLKLYLTHPTYNPRILSWDGSTDDGWTIAEIAPDAQTWDAMTYYRLGELVKHGATYYVCKTATAGDWNINTAPGGAEWTVIVPTAGKLDPFTGAGEYPAAVANHESRLIFAGFGNTANRVIAEMVETPDVLFPGPNPADPWDHRIAGETDQIVWAASAKHLILGTVGEEIIAFGGEAGLTPDSVHFKSHTAYGSMKRQAILVGDDVIFIQRGARKIRALQFAESQGGYAASDITLLSDHITESGVTDLAYQQDPDSIVWAVREDGVLIGATYSKEFNTIGWHRHPTDATHLSVAAIPTATEDELWLATERTVNGATVRYMEYMESRRFATRSDRFYVDCGITATGSGITSVSGLDHLEGELVDVVTDGKQHSQKTVSSGAISLDVAADKVQVGLNIPCVLRTMRMDLATRLGTSRGLPLRVVNFIGHFVDTVGCQVGPDVDHLDTMHFTTFGMGMGEVIPLYSGTKEQTFPGEYDQNGYIYIKQAIPQPFTLVGIVAEVEVAAA